MTEMRSGQDEGGHQGTVSGKVLVVEDDGTTRMILASMLEDMGLDVVEAIDGRAALDLLAEESGSFDVIVLDRHMPEVDGLEVIRQLRCSDYSDVPPLIMLTGDTEADEVREILDAGVFECLAKPWDAEVLETVIRSAVSEAGRNRGTSYSELLKV